jgi:hypothetical protein
MCKVSSKKKTGYINIHTLYNNTVFIIATMYMYTSICVSLDGFFLSNFKQIVYILRGRSGRDRMIVGFATTLYLCNQCLSPLTL